MTDEFFKQFRIGEYQKGNFDDFLKRIKFSFNIPSVHIAGTNGKGTTLNFLSSMYINEGYKVGTFSSPHFERVNELIKVNNDEISDDNFISIFNDYKDILLQYNLSPFEVQTFVAFKYFESMKCDICFIECGMGGRLDATNIFTPILSIITSVGLEHTEYLGKTYAEIAYSKAGIIKENIPVVTGYMNDDSLKVISDVCVSKKSPLHMTVDSLIISQDNSGINFSYSKFKNVHINSTTLYSLKDACVALESVDLINQIIPIKEENIFKGLLANSLPCRFSKLSYDENTIIDGAHNPEAAEELRKDILIYAKSKPIHIVFCCFKDKNLSSILMSLGQATNDIVFTTFNNKRARNEEEYFLFLGDYRFEQNPIQAYRDLKSQYPDDIILITGSLGFARYMQNELEGK